MSLFQADSVRRGGVSALLYAAADRKHRPASHPLLSGRTAPLPVEWEVTAYQIRRRRILRGLSQGQLARLMRVSRPAVAQWESGAYLPSDEHCARLREVLR